MMIYFISGVTSGAKPYSEAEITALEPGRRIAWRAGIPKGTGFFNLAEWEFILEPRGQDTCVSYYRGSSPVACPGSTVDGSRHA
jgi:hypothetical protein